MALSDGTPSRTGKRIEKPLLAAHLLRRLGRHQKLELHRVFRRLRAIHRQATRLETRLLRTFRKLLRVIDSDSESHSNLHHSQAIALENVKMRSPGPMSKRLVDERKQRKPRKLPGTRRLLYPYDLYTQTSDRAQAIAEERGPFFERWEAGEKYWESTGDTTD